MQKCTHDNLNRAFIYIRCASGKQETVRAVGLCVRLTLCAYETTHISRARADSNIHHHIVMGACEGKGKRNGQ